MIRDDESWSGNPNREIDDNPQIDRSPSAKQSSPKATTEVIEKELENY